MLAPQIQSKAASEVRNLAVDFRGMLDSGELLTGAVTVTEATGDLTIDNEQVSAAALTILGQAVAAGQAVQLRVAGGTAGLTYTLAIAVGTDATPAQTLRGTVKLKVTDD